MTENSQGPWAPQDPNAGAQSYGQPPAGPPTDPYASTGPAYGQAPGYGQDTTYGQDPTYGQTPTYEAPPAYGAPQSGYGQPSGGYPSYGGPVVASVGVSDMAQVPGLGMVRIANIGKRFGARIIDGLILSVVYGIIMGIAVAAASAGDEVGFGLMMGIMFFSSLLMLAYEGLMNGLKGATLGKMAMGLRVVTTKGEDPCGIGPAFVRYLILGACNMVPLLGLVCYLSPLFDQSGLSQGWHDKVAGTLVIDVKG